MLFGYEIYLDGCLVREETELDFEDYDEALEAAEEEVNDLCEEEGWEDTDPDELEIRVMELDYVPFNRF